MATYTVSSGRLICTGTNITTAGIVAAINANSGSLNTVGGSAASASTTLTEHGYRTSIISSDFYIGDGSTASTWVAENESITVWANIIGFNNANVRFGLKNANGTYSNPVFLVMIPQTTHQTQQDGKRWQLLNGGHFEAYGSTIICDNLLTYEPSVGDVTFERCFLSIIDGLGEGSGTYGTTNSPTVKYIDCIMDGHVGVGLKLYQQINYVLDRVSITNNTYGIQAGQDARVLTDSKLDTNTYHSVPNVGNNDVTLINSDITTLRVAFSDSSDIHRLVQRFDYQSVDTSGSPLNGVKVRIVDQSSDVVVNSEATDSSGRLSTLPTYGGVQCLPYKTYAGTVETLRANHTFFSYRYGYGITYKTISVQPNVDIKELDFKPADPNINSSKVVADAYALIGTSAKFYDRAAAYLEDNTNNYINFLVTRSGNLINAGAYNVNVDATASSAFSVSGNTITIKANDYADDMTTTGVITLSNGAIFSGTRTDANGTVFPPQPISTTNISAGSRLQLYNVTTSTETVNEVVSGTSYTSSYTEGVEYTDGDIVQWKLTKLGKEELTGTVIATSSGFSVRAEQVDSTVYAAMGVNGSTVTKFAADYSQGDVNLVVSSDWTMAELYAWWMYNLTTEQGIREFFGGITALDQSNFRINTATANIYLDNNTNASHKQTDNRRLFRDTGDGYPIKSPTTSGYGLDAVWRNTILIAETGISGLTSAESAKLDVISSVDNNTKLIPALL